MFSKWYILNSDNLKQWFIIAFYKFSNIKQLKCQMETLKSISLAFQLC
jgi:hypothetical protein